MYLTVLKSTQFTLDAVSGLNKASSRTAVKSSNHDGWLPMPRPVITEKWEPLMHQTQVASVGRYTVE